jgi:hypothetical protein
VERCRDLRFRSGETPCQLGLVLGIALNGAATHVVSDRLRSRRWGGAARTRLVFTAVASAAADPMIVPVRDRDVPQSGLERPNSKIEIITG